ncbi:MAG: tRNA (adenosine(37)-N6)-threonylcarbamoyltransferase complex dimerization subunit type 1 TsaB [Verrucomicrobia bacterium]|nr:tRNA (adenosine(37)-N6)-threonylcarbamoyltransferase complex dimerization subunit type 1 TsaB [Verrucomicrobiota bacterium]
MALEFSSARRGAAVVEVVPAVCNRRLDASSATEGDSTSAARGGRVLGLAVAEGIVPGPFELIESALRSAGVEREQVECIAVGLGPGSYTGIRSAIALAQGWQLALGVKLLGISTAEVLASTAQAAGVAGRVTVVIDALREEFYSASYEITAGGWRETAPLRLLKREAVEALAAAGEILLSPDGKCLPAGAKLVLPSAAELGRLASLRDDFQPGEKLEPIYLRETSFVKAPAPRFY